MTDHEYVPVDAVNAYAYGDDETLCIALRTAEGWQSFRLVYVDADQLQGMLHLLLKRW